LTQETTALLLLGERLSQLNQAQTSPLNQQTPEWLPRTILYSLPGLWRWCPLLTIIAIALSCQRSRQRKRRHPTTRSQNLPQKPPTRTLLSKSQLQLLLTNHPPLKQKPPERRPPTFTRHTADIGIKLLPR